MSVQVLYPFNHGDPEHTAGFWFWCPGCKTRHPLYTKYPHKLVWGFNNDLIKPTFTPSLIVAASEPERRCHLFVKDGQLQFLGDCWHDLKNKTVPMVPDPT